LKLDGYENRDSQLDACGHRSDILKLKNFRCQAKKRRKKKEKERQKKKKAGEALGTLPKLGSIKRNLRFMSVILMNLIEY